MEGTSLEGANMRKQIDLAKTVLSEHNPRSFAVKHLKGSSKYAPKGGGTWKKFWIDKSNGRQFPEDKTKCLSCGNPTNADKFVGGHVFEVANQNKMYICPVCESCNSTYGKGKKESPKFIVTSDDCVDFTYEDAELSLDKSE